ncbi:hypothetical protein ACP4OV_029061 [Aristida adscensionis]
MSFNGESSSGAEGSSSDEASGSQPSQWRPRTASKWPTDKIIVTEISDDGYPTDKKALQRMRLLAGLAARQGSHWLLTPSQKSVRKKGKNSIFEKFIQTKLEFREDMKKSACKRAWLMIGKLRRNFRSTLATQFDLLVDS